MTEAVAGKGIEIGVALIPFMKVKLPVRAPKAMPKPTKDPSPVRAADKDTPAPIDCNGAKSFSGATLVLMANGTVKSIEDVVVGDEVLAADPESGQQEPRLVTHIWPHRDDFITLEVGGGLIQTTEDHPFWNSTDRQWQRADELDAGDMLVTSEGLPAEVGEVGTWRAFDAGAYNLTVDGLHTYYVLADNTPVLVHNCDRGGLDFTDAERQKVYDANLDANDGVLKCEYCGRDVVRRPSESGVPGRPDDAQIDHVEPRAAGGHGGAHNGAVACRRCNRDKSTKPMEEWDDELRELLE
ncbi:polymorphic toxin-type HINT domain-containing protein [Catenuloplanes sp. NPDC051500]|uniref:polymorphic toxin-type HINT domain-containing protein n=1 Tax=Catenuloplanes sp. NPDC051500 TaxID=3363959 RepID=UPI0037BDC96A